MLFLFRWLYGKMVQRYENWRRQCAQLNLLYDFSLTLGATARK